MSERASLWLKNTDPEHQHIQTLEIIGKKALNIVDCAYGCGGFPKRNPSQDKLGFHNGHHGRGTGNTSLRLCAALGLSPVMQTVGQTAGFGHDIVYRQRRGQDEADSAAWLDEQLAKIEMFPPHLRQIGTLAILGTVPEFENGILIAQQASTLEYPSEDAELIAKSVASADLGVLYAPEGPYQSHQFMREINGMATHIALKDMINFQRNQVILLETYCYPLKKANEMLTTHQREVIEYTKRQLRRMERGDITSLDQLVEDDITFYFTHS